MRNQWYGDNRDLVKWATLLGLASDHKLEHILHIAMLRPCEWGELLADEWPNLDRNGKEWIRIQDCVRSHFRDIRDIRRLATSSSVSIQVAEEIFESRQQYFAGVVDRIKRDPRRLIAFLDPDTGIAPANHNLKHVRPDELRAVYDALKPADFLVLYQHARQRVRTWREDTRREFRQALNQPDESIESISCRLLAHDVVFYVVEKRSPTS